MYSVGAVNEPDHYSCNADKRRSRSNWSWCVCVPRCDGVCLPERCLFSRPRASDFSCSSATTTLSRASSALRRWFSPLAFCSSVVSSSTRLDRSPFATSSCFSLFRVSLRLAFACSQRPSSREYQRVGNTRGQCLI